jgi:hypothetical protein
MRGVLLLVLLAVSATPQSAIADDASANFLLRLFMSVCILNVGQPEKGPGLSGGEAPPGDHESDRPSRFCWLRWKGRRLGGSISFW